jgi:hypothetical protein
MKVAVTVPDVAVPAQVGFPPAGNRPLPSYGYGGGSQAAESDWKERR